MRSITARATTSSGSTTGHPRSSCAPQRHRDLGAAQEQDLGSQPLHQEARRRFEPRPRLRIRAAELEPFQGWAPINGFHHQPALQSRAVLLLPENIEQAHGTQAPLRERPVIEAARQRAVGGEHAYRGPGMVAGEEGHGLVHQLHQGEGRDLPQPGEHEMRGVADDDREVGTGEPAQAAQQPGKGVLGRAGQGRRAVGRLRDRAQDPLREVLLRAHPASLAGGPQQAALEFDVRERPEPAHDAEDRPAVTSLSHRSHRARPPRAARR